MEDSRQRDRENVRVSHKASRARGVERAQQFIFGYLSSRACTDCGTADISVLTFHHLDPRNKRYNVTSGTWTAVLIARLYPGGLLRDEAAKLAMEDFAQTANRLVVKGKRNKQQYVFLAEGAITALSAWLSIWGSNPEAVFYPINKKGTITPRKSATKPSIISFRFPV